MGELKLDRLVLEPLLDNTLELNDLDAPVILSFLWRGKHARSTSEGWIKTCQSDIYKIVNMLMNYARMLKAAVE